MTSPLTCQHHGCNEPATVSVTRTSESGATVLSARLCYQHAGVKREVVGIPSEGRPTRLWRLFKGGFASVAMVRVSAAAALIGVIAALLDLSFGATVLALLSLAFGAFGAAYCGNKRGEP